MSLRHDLELVVLFARQSLSEGYRSSSFGVLWLFVEQFIFILIYTLVFSRVMGARLGQFTSPYAFSIYLVSGVLSWNFMAGIILRLAEVYRGKAHYIRKVPIRLGLLPLFVPLAEFSLLAVGGILYILFLVGIGHGPVAAWWWLAPALAALLLFAYGAGLLLGILNVFFPDIKHLIGIWLQFAFWLTPIVYVPDLLPAWATGLLWLNLPYLGIRAMQQIFFFQAAPAPLPLAVLAASGITLLIVALLLLHRVERDIRDLV